MTNVLILMPVLNEAKNIEQSIKSIQEQTFEDWTLVIQDNQSDDNTVEIVSLLMATDSRIKLLKSESRLNVQDNWSSLANQALATIDSTFVIWMGGDDLWSTKDFLMGKIARIEASSNLSCVASGVKNFGGEDSELISLGSSSGLRFRRLFDYLRDYKQINVLWALTPRKTFVDLVNHKSFNVGGFPGFDWYFCLGLFFAGKVDFDPGSVYLKRARSNTIDSLGVTKSSLGINSYKAFMAPYKQTFWAQRTRLRELPLTASLLIMTWQAIASHLRMIRLITRKCVIFFLRGNS